MHKSDNLRINRHMPQRCSSRRNFIKKVRNFNDVLTIYGYSEINILYEDIMNIKIKDSNKGATMIEYALIAGLIAIVAITAMQSLGNKVSSKMNHITEQLGT